MKKACILLTTLLLSLLLFSCELFMEEPQAGKVYAILVALDYKNSTQPSLDGTLPDARELNLALQAVTMKSKAKASGYEGFLFLQEGVATSTEEKVKIGDKDINTFPTSENILDAIKNLKTTPKDLIIFTYSGHGSEEGGLLLAINGQETNEEFPASKILDALEDVPGRKLVILDTCYSGVSMPESGASHSTLMNNNILKWYKKYRDNSKDSNPGIFVLTASTNTRSYETDLIDGHRHGRFTFVLLEALGWTHPHAADLSNINLKALSPPPAAKNSILSVDTLYTFIKKYKKPTSVLAYFSPKVQRPMVSGGALDMILFTF